MLNSDVIPAEVQAELPVTVLAAPEGFAAQRHSALMKERARYGLPTRVTRDYLGEPVAVVFQIVGCRRDLRYDNPAFAQARKAVSSIANLLFEKPAEFHAEQMYLRSHKHGITLAVPIHCVGEYGLDAAWTLGFQRARFLQDIINANVKDRDCRAELYNGLLPGITQDGYLTAYPKQLYRNPLRPQPGGETIWKATHLLSDWTLLSGDAARAATLKAMLRNKPELAREVAGNARRHLQALGD